MAPSYLRVCLKLLELTVILMGLFATSGLKQCGPKTIVIIKNVGIKMCQLRCIEIGQCLSYDYNVETLTCRLSRDDPPKVKKKEGYINRSKNYSDESSGSCVGRTCSLGQRCLKSRSGKAVCVQDEKQIHYEESQQHNLDKLVTSVDDPLHDACRKGEMSRVKRILCRELVEVNIRDKRYGRTPLMVAAQNGHRDVVDFLVSEGGNVSQVDNNCNSALHLACRRGDVGMVNHLVSEYSVDVNRKSKIGTTPLMTTAQYGHQDVFDVLVSAGANVSQMDDDGDNILHYASIGGHEKMIQHIISQDMMDINSKGRYERTPLMRAAYYGHKKAFEILVKTGGLTQLVDNKRHNILHLASLGGHMEMVKHILSKNMADINARDKVGNTAAMLAKRKRKPDIYNLLVSLGSPVK